MRKFIVIGAISAAFLIAAPATYALAAPSHDQIVGTGALGQFGSPTVHVNANQTQSGPKGSFTITYPDGTAVQGKVTCIFVNKKVGYVTGKITESSGPRSTPNNWAPGNFVVVGVQDNGQSGPDDLNFSPGFAADPGCGPNGDAVPLFAIVSGDYRVTDA
jgi:hypothetical protein